MKVSRYSDFEEPAGDLDIAVMDMGEPPRPTPEQYWLGVALLVLLAVSLWGSAKGYI